MQACNTKKGMRDAFIEALYDYAYSNREIIFVSNEYGAPALDRFRHELPEQFINAGISEQNLMSMSAGLAMEGKKPFVYSIASFITLRCYEQIKLDVCVHSVPVCILGVGSCYAYSEDGPSHHATEDIAIMRELVGMHIYSPSDSQMASCLVSHVVALTGPSYVRFDRADIWTLDGKRLPDFNLGLRVLRKGASACIVATGIMVSRALEVAERLRQDGIDITVIDLFRLKPLPINELSKLVSQYDHIFSFEEHAFAGGLGSMMAEMICDNQLCCRLHRCAIEEKNLYAYGTRGLLHEKNKLDCTSLMRRIRGVIMNEKE